MKPYKYQNPRIARPDFTVQGVSRVGSMEQLTGFINGEKASDLEERMNNSFTALKVSSTFRQRISSLLSGSRRLQSAMTNLPGEVEIDLLLDHQPVIPVFIDGQISHFMSPWQRDKDIEKAAVVDEFGASMGWAHSVRVPFVDILTPEASDRVARRILEGTYQPTFIG